jgi:GNAT superfamily N-acetyltransferase
MAESDVEACGRILQAAFLDVARRHGFVATDFQPLEAAVRSARSFFADPTQFSCVAELDGRVVGMGGLREWDAIRGVGPIAVDPAAQGRGVGRAVMEAVLDRARGAAGARLLQDAFNRASLSLYAALGFAAKEPLALLSGEPRGQVPPDVAVRPLAAEDREAAEALCRAVYRVDRANELAAGIARRGRFRPQAVVRAGRLAAFTASPLIGYGGFAVAETLADLQALILGQAAAQGGVAELLVPLRHADLFRWCLAIGLHVVKPMNLMAIGAYEEPTGPYLPSVFY